MADRMKGRQIDAIKCMLNLNNSTNGSEALCWKILVYDQVGRDIISPLLTVKDLRSHGVTLHLHIDSPREQIPEVPCVYFVYPSKENIINICKDLQSGRYESYYLNFISPISREQLEEIAQTALSENCVDQIMKIFDQYTNFICLEDDFIVLGNMGPDCYSTLNYSKASNFVVENIVNNAVDGLFSVFATLGNIPVIRCPKGNASEIIATKLDNKFRDCMKDSRNSLFMHNNSRSYTEDVGQTNRTNSNPNALYGPNLFQRPLLVLIDRGLDLGAPLHHELSYQCLIHDIFNIGLNRIKVNLDLVNPQSVNGDCTNNNNSSSSKGKFEEYVLNTSTDRMWRELRNSTFVDVAEAIQEEVKAFKEYEKRMNELKTSLGVTSENDLSLQSGGFSSLDDNTAKLTNAISSLPQLIERKRLLDMHMNTASCLASVIKQRQLNVFADEEDHLCSKSMPSSDNSLSELIGNKDIGSAEDKLRLLIISALQRKPTSSSIVSSSTTPANTTTTGTGTNSNSAIGGSVANSFSNFSEFFLSDSELEKLKLKLINIYPDLDVSSINYIQRFRNIPKSGRLMDELKNSDGKTSRSMLDKIVSHGSAIFMTGVRHLISQKSYLPLTRIVSQLMENKSSPEVDDYRYFDPKLNRRQDNNIPRINQNFNHVFVFVIGGGCYVEYQNLLDFIRPSSSTSTTTLNNTTNSLSSSLSNLAQPSNLNLASDIASSLKCTNEKRIVYGCTDLVSPSSFLHQLTTLGKN